MDLNSLSLSVFVSLSLTYACTHPHTQTQICLQGNSNTIKTTIGFNNKLDEWMFNHEDLLERPCSFCHQPDYIPVLFFICCITLFWLNYMKWVWCHSHPRLIFKLVMLFFLFHTVSVPLGRSSGSCSCLTWAVHCLFNSFRYDQLNCMEPLPWEPLMKKKVWH